MTAPEQRPATLRHERVPESTTRQRQLLAEVRIRASHVTEQMLILPVEARRVGASEADLRAVRATLLEPFERECKG